MWGSRRLLSPVRSALLLLAVTAMVLASAGMAYAVGSISGTVTDGSVGVPNVRVWTYRLSGGSWWSGNTGTTTSNGTYQVTGLTAGIYRVLFAKGG